LTQRWSNYNIQILSIAFLLLISTSQNNVELLNLIKINDDSIRNKLLDVFWFGDLKNELFSNERYFDGDIVLTDLPLMKSVDRIMDDEIICVYSVNNIEAPENLFCYAMIILHQFLIGVKQYWVLQSMQNPLSNMM